MGQPDINAASFDQLVSALGQVERNRNAKSLGSFEVDDQLDFVDPLHRQIAWLLTLENPANVDARCLVRL
jgi:hypothetical protein